MLGEVIWSIISLESDQEILSVNRDVNKYKWKK